MISLTLNGLNKAVIPRIAKTLNIEEPTAFPTIISPSFFIQATIEVANSGSDVPKANSVRPITASLSPKALAHPIPPFSKKKAPRTNKINPANNKAIKTIPL